MHCTVCRNPRRRAIERALWRMSIRDVAAKYDLARTTVHRHLDHMRERIQTSRALRKEFEADCFWEDGERVWALLLAAVARAKRTGEHKDVAAALANLITFWTKRGTALGMIGAPSVHVDASQQTLNATVSLDHAVRVGHVLEELGVLQAVAQRLRAPTSDGADDVVD